MKNVLIVVVILVAFVEIQSRLYAQDSAKTKNKGVQKTGEVQETSGAARVEAKTQSVKDLLRKLRKLEPEFRRRGQEFESKKSQFSSNTKDSVQKALNLLSVNIRVLKKRIAFLSDSLWKALKRGPVIDMTKWNVITVVCDGVEDSNSTFIGKSLAQIFGASGPRTQWDISRDLGYEGGDIWFDGEALNVKIGRQGTSCDNNIAVCSRTN